MHPRIFGVQIFLDTFYLFLNYLGRLRVDFFFVAFVYVVDHHLEIFSLEHML